MRDALGNIRTIIDGSGNITESRLYSPYGEPYGGTGSAQTTYGFTGEPTDSTGFVHLRARYYNPSLGQFMNLDPAETPNRFAYVDGNPVNRTDHMGLVYEDDAGMGSSTTGVSTAATGAAVGCAVGGAIGSVLGIGSAAGCAIGAGVGGLLGGAASTPAGSAVASSIGSAVGTMGNLAVQTWWAGIVAQQLADDEAARREHRALLERQRQNQIRARIAGGRGKTFWDYPMQTGFGFEDCQWVTMTYAQFMASQGLLNNQLNNQAKKERKLKKGFGVGTVTLTGNAKGEFGMFRDETDQMTQTSSTTLDGTLAFAVKGDIMGINGTISIAGVTTINLPASSVWGPVIMPYSGVFNVTASGTIDIRQSSYDLEIIPGTCTWWAGIELLVTRSFPTDSKVNSGPVLCDVYTTEEGDKVEPKASPLGSGTGGFTLGGMITVMVCKDRAGSKSFTLPPGTETHEWWKELDDLPVSSMSA